jgi:hypothetical protein
VSLQRIGVMEYRARQVAVLDVHILESVSVFLLQELIKKRFLEVYSFDIEQSYEAVVITLGQDRMKHVSSFIIDINFLMNDVLRCTCLRHQIQCNILKPKVPSYIQRRPPELISFNDKLKNVILTLDNSFIVTVIVLIEA